MTSDLQPEIDAIGAIPAVPIILDVVCRTTGMRFAAVARVTESRWIACSVKDDIAFGLVPGSELKLETTICHEVRDSREAVVINNVSKDGLFSDHPTPALYGFQSYISVPIILADGSFFGTLCAIDPKPAELQKPEVIGMFKLFAGLIAHHLDSYRQLQASEAALADAREAGELREMFIAVLGHDLRNPLSAISVGIQLIGRTPVNERAGRLLTMMQQSVLRMTELISNVLDFARGRMGSGIALNRDATQPLGPVLDQVVGELCATWPRRQVDTHFMLTEAVDCDRDRIGQMFSNLLSNAFTYGAPDQPIRVDATAHDGGLELSVANAGTPIPPDALNRMFEPFARGSHPSNEQGLGLGLHIAREIALAHGGRLTAVSTPAETRFTFQMPA